LDNARDRDSKGRRPALHGEAHGRAVLTENDVREIRSVPDRHGVTAALARKYGVSFSTVRCVRDGTSWKSVI
jgi:hypothetical protein